MLPKFGRHRTESWPWTLNQGPWASKWWGLGRHYSNILATYSSYRVLLGDYIMHIFDVSVTLNWWGWVPHVCVSKLTIIGSDNGLSPGSWTNAGILSIESLGTNFSEILIEIYTFSFEKMHLKMSSARWRPITICRPQYVNLLTPGDAYTILVQACTWHFCHFVSTLMCWLLVRNVSLHIHTELGPQWLILFASAVVSALIIAIRPLYCIAIDNGFIACVCAWPVDHIWVTGTLTMGRQSLQTESRYDAYFVITSGTWGCRYDNLMCHQWWQSWHHDESWFRVITDDAFY